MGGLLSFHFSCGSCRATMSRGPRYCISTREPAGLAPSLPVASHMASHTCDGVGGWQHVIRDCTACAGRVSPGMRQGDGGGSSSSSSRAVAATAQRYEQQHLRLNSKKTAVSNGQPYRPAAASGPAGAAVWWLLGVTMAAAAAEAACRKPATPGAESSRPNRYGSPLFATA